MPNGGSDCCGTCWFNAKNKREAGYDHAEDPEQDFCQIRRIAIETPFWTYCANHPHRCPDRAPIPIGPIYIDKGHGRKLWQASPDTEAIREHLLGFIESIQEQPKAEYLPGYERDRGFFRDEIVVWQLGEFQEIRALGQLKRIEQFDPEASVGDSPFERTRATLVEAAFEAIAKILGSESSNV